MARDADGLTASQREALEWLRKQGGTGVLTSARLKKGGYRPVRFMARGVYSKFSSTTWQALIGLELLDESNGRLSLTDKAVTMLTRPKPRVKVSTILKPTSSKGFDGNGRRERHFEDDGIDEGLGYYNND